MGQHQERLQPQLTPNRWSLLEGMGRLGTVLETSDVQQAISVVQILLTLLAMSCSQRS